MRHAAKIKCAALLVVIGTSSASGTECANDIKVETGATQKIIACLVELQKENMDLSKQLSDLKKEQRPVVPLDVLPEHVVVAVDSPKGCPSGWTDLSTADPDRFSGRTIVAVGPRVDRDNDLTTRKRSYNDQGGSESHLLKTSEIPPLSFSIQVNVANSSKVDRYNAGGRDYPVVTTEQQTLGGTSEGNGEPFPTMSPYVALFFCRLDRY